VKFVLAGAGLRCEHLNERVKRAILEAEEVWVDTYTSPFPGGLLNCVKGVREDALEADRSVLEGPFRFSKSVTLVVPGDPMAATAHSALLLEARRRGYSVQIISNVSALQAARSKSGLSQYRFGKVVTLMYPKEGISFTESVYNVIKDNDSMNLHTIVLLETGYGRDMTVPEAARLLCEYEELCDRRAIAMARLCWDDETIKVAKLRELAESDLGGPPHLLVFPSPKLHPIEEEFIEAVLK